MDNLKLKETKNEEIKYVWEKKKSPSSSRNYIQQGDTIMVPIGIRGVFHKEYKNIPEAAIEQETNLVLKGQQNSHALYGGKFEIMDYDGVRFVRVIENTLLDHVKDHTMLRPNHAEHHAQVIPAGDYFIYQINEYDHIEEENRKIID